MYPELEVFNTDVAPTGLINAAKQFLETGDPSVPRGVSVSQDIWDAESTGSNLVTDIGWNENTEKLLRFFIYLSDGNPGPVVHPHMYLVGVLNAVLSEDSKVRPEVAEAVADGIDEHHQNLEEFIEIFLNSYARSNAWDLSDPANSQEPFVNPVANLVFRNIGSRCLKDPSSLSDHSGLFGALAVHRPEITHAWAEQALSFKSWHLIATWSEIVKVSDEYDESCLTYCKNIPNDDAADAFRILTELNDVRGGKYEDVLIEAASRPQAALGHEGLELLFEKIPARVVEVMARAFEIPDAGQHTSFTNGPAYTKLFSKIRDEWDSSGASLLRNVISNYSSYQIGDLLKERLTNLKPQHYPVLRDSFLTQVEKQSPQDRIEMWRIMAETYPRACLGDFENLLKGKSKPLRELSAKVVAKERGREVFKEMEELLGSRKADSRLGAAAYFEHLSDSTAAAILKSAVEIEKSEKVRDALRKAHSACEQDSDVDSEPSAMSLQEIEAEIASLANRMKLPKCKWLNIEALPQLVTEDGTLISPKAAEFLIVKQAKHKLIEIAPDALPLLSHLERKNNAEFAINLVEGFLDSDQVAADRWALTLGGLLGDQRIIPPLLSRIQGWCENSRHKLAEYAAQAISLLPGDEPLMVLDTLATRYRSKFKNVGKACAAAFEAAAVARGITPDELGDMVVPSFEFDEDGVRTFEWEDGSISAELGPDFKLQWFDAETEKSWKSIPAFVPDEVKDEVKLLNKMIRETMKGQTARLELTLVRQRRWPVARWRELFENHPVLKSFASRLVWGIYDASGSLLRSFRRYPNGLLADAAGELEELPEKSVEIGMIHPLELDKESLDAWRAHLSRMKVKPPFPQLDRPVELLDPLHGNRKEITISRDKEVGAGTFRSRSEKRGWVRGSVIDAGGISSIYKQFPGAEIEVVLPTNNFWIGIDPMDTVELSSAYFVKEGTVERGSYEYDEPGPDDPRVLRFDQVPAVVYSETLADLKAITYQAEK
ncbi:DUF4132 domain-containing protein [Haloferula chungangensis]|uniref:DUF4132 domain-containing protein n=1 Tax=Haloferula chungangensis TaxID=1048331 RepID=A0ABW2L7I5_9BACT